MFDRIKNIFSEKQILERFYNDLDIYTADGREYSSKKIANIDIELINFTYDNAVLHMQEIEARTLSTRDSAEWLLRLLSANIIALGALFYSNLDLLSEKTTFTIFDFSIMPIVLAYASKAILFAYLVIIFFLSRLLLSRSFSIYTYNEPKNLMTKEMFQYSVKLVKIFEIESLQDRISINIQRQYKYAKELRLYTHLTGGNTLFAFAVFCILVVVKLSS